MNEEDGNVWKTSGRSGSFSILCIFLAFHKHCIYPWLKTRSIPLQSKFFQQVSRDWSRICILLHSAFTPPSTHALGNLAPKQISSVSYSGVLNPPLRKPLFILGENNWHETGVLVSACRKEFQQHARSKTCLFPSSPCWQLQSLVITAQMLWDPHSYLSQESSKTILYQRGKQIP